MTCVTHHHACDCREKSTGRLIELGTMMADRFIMGGGNKYVVEEWRKTVHELYGSKTDK